MAPPGEDGGVNNSSNTSSQRSSKRLSAAASQWAGSLMQSTKHTVQSWTVRKYNLPDKHVASQILMYRQLLHTACRANLTLSREYQGTPAQQAVLDMPWWSQGILQTRKMIISYQNLLARLWVAGACTPYQESWMDYYVAPPPPAAPTIVALPPAAAAPKDDDAAAKETETTSGSIEEKKEANETVAPATTAEPAAAEEEEEVPDQAKFRAPVPHGLWVDRLGFQQDDPVTDFRSGGVLSLAMMVYLVESCPETYGRFILDGDAAMLPFGLTCINITDMMAKFLMMSKSTDRMDALLSQKPFWRMFADPHAMLVCQETAMQLTADVVVEVQTERGSPVTVFDFANILAIVEKRMEYDYLMAGPTSSADLKKIHVRNKKKYQQQMQQRISMARTKSAEEEKKRKEEEENDKIKDVNELTEQTAAASLDDDETPAAKINKIVETSKEALAPRLQAAKEKASILKDKASVAAGNMWTKMKTPGFNTLSQQKHAPDNDSDPSSFAIPDDVHDEESSQSLGTGQAESNAAPAYQGELDDDAEDVDL